MSKTIKLEEISLKHHLLFLNGTERRGTDLRGAAQHGVLAVLGLLVVLEPLLAGQQLTQVLKGRGREGLTHKLEELDSSLHLH